MLIIDHWLHNDDGSPIRRVESPNVGGEFAEGALQYLIMHYTAMASAAAAIQALTRKGENPVSAHVVIARDGTVTQLVPFNRVAWHAGKSKWGDLVGLNSHALGIEIDNGGFLARVPGTNQWTLDAHRGKPNPPVRYGAEDVISGVHKYERVTRTWHRYSEAQIDAAAEVARTLVLVYGLKEIVGHEDVSHSLSGKVDPGPAFPWERIRRAEVMS